MYKLLRSALALSAWFVVYNTNAQDTTQIRSSKVDSASSVLKQQSKAVTSQLSAPVSSLKTTAKQAIAPLQQLNQGINIFDNKKPITVSHLSTEVDYNYFQDTSGMGLGVLQNMTGTFSYLIDYTVGINNMPFAMTLREGNGINSMNYTPFKNFTQFNFDHEQYLQTLRSQVMAKVSPDAIMNSALSRVKTIRMNYEQQLQGEISHMQSDYTKQYNTPLPIPTDAKDLSANDMSALRNRLLPGSAVTQYQQNLSKLSYMSQGKDQKTLAADSNYQKTLAEVKGYETMEKVYDRITFFKSKYEDNPLVKQLLSTSSYSPGALKNYLSDPNHLSQVLDDQASLNTIQKLFYNLKTLNLGQNSVNTNDMSMANVVNTGVNGEFQNKSASVGMIYGQNNSVNNWQQAGLTSSVTNEYSNLTGFKVGGGNGSQFDQSLSVNFFNFNNSVNSLGSNSGASYLPVAPRQDGVITLHFGMPIGAKHNVTLDVSKSFGSPNQGSSTDSSGSKSGSEGSLFSNSGKANYAATLNYTGEIYKTDIRVYLRKVGLGYNNPGNALLHSGESEMGLDLARKFLSNRLTVKYAGDFKQQVFDPYSNFVYTSIGNKLSTGFKIDRNDKVTLTWQRTDYKTDFYGQSPMNGVNSRLQLDGAYRFIVDGKKIMNNITLSRQTMNIPMTYGGEYSNTSVLFTNTSSMMLGKNLLSLTILTNQSTNNNYFFNTSMFSAEMGYSYSVSGPGNLKMTTTPGYYDNQGWNTQLGIRQQMSASLSGKMNVDLQFGYKKGIQVIQTALANQLFVSTSAHYTFK